MSSTALRTAEAAEEDAAAAIEVAEVLRNVAEYAVIDAALAPNRRDDLAVALGLRPAGATS